MQTADSTRDSTGWRTLRTAARPVARVLLLAAACATGAAMAAPPPRSALISAVYRCDDGSLLRVRFAGQAAQVTLPNRTRLRLPQQRSGSGFRYASARHELIGKGDEVMWTAARRAPLQCSVRR